VKGTLSYVLPIGVIVDISATEVTVSVTADQYNNLWGLVRTLIDNMVV
jgi:ribosomal protein L6P/L9E